MPGPTTATGVVTAFDDAAGLGEVTTSDGVVHPFHCTAIADGTRTIDVGAEVTFDVVAGRSGRWEASRLRSAGALRSPGPTPRSPA